MRANSFFLFLCRDPQTYARKQQPGGSIYPNLASSATFLSSLLLNKCHMTNTSAVGVYLTPLLPH